MAALNISEHKLPTSFAGSVGNDAFPMPAIASQVVQITAASLRSAQFNAFTHGLLLTSDVSCSVKVGDATVVATANDLRIGPNVTPIPLAVPPGGYIAVIAN